MACKTCIAQIAFHLLICRYAQNPLNMCPRNFPVDREVANLLRTCWRHGKLSWHVKIVCRVANKSAASPHYQRVVIMEFGKRHDITDTTDLCPRAHLLRTWCGLATGKLQENWCNGFWLLRNSLPLPVFLSMHWLDWTPFHALPHFTPPPVSFWYLRGELYFYDSVLYT